MATIIDEGEIRCNRMLQILSATKELLTREQLIVECASSPEGGMSQEEVMNTLFQLKTKKFIYTNDFHTPQTYGLTASGKAAVPPKYVKDLAQYKPDDGGMKHIHGMNGKVDFSKPLKGAKKLLYEACSRPMNMRQLCIAANMQENHAWVYVDELVKMEVFAKSKTTADGVIFSRARIMRTEEDLKEPAKPVLTPADKSDPIFNKITDNVSPIVSNFSKSNPTLKEAIEELMSHYSASDIVFECFVQIDTEMKELTQFRDSILNTTKASKK